MAERISEHACFGGVQGFYRHASSAILIDQGLDDQFLEKQLLPHVFEAACVAARQPLNLRHHPGYDHGYYFISTLIEDHLAFHSRNLRA